MSADVFRPTEICIGAENCLISDPAPEIGDLDLGIVRKFPGLIKLGPLPIISGSDQPITWSLVSFAPDSGPQMLGPATVDPTTGEFIWHPDFDDWYEPYSAVIRATSPFGFDEATLSFHLYPVPEPTALVLLGVGISSLFGCTRRCPNGA
jgi:hypothetical protein